eukprot:Seg1359.13 transcript_id=Seg1359.13/GoldUCD/mRNA.D3Y31 product="hypothetical protein" protein_id=Seg1359.13/GoldUCD/D3Y31
MGEVTLPILKEMLDMQRASFQILVDDVKSEIKSLKKDFEFETSISFVSNVNDSLTENIEEMENKICKVNKSVAMLGEDTQDGLDMMADQQEYLENQSRRNNVKISGVPESETEINWDETEKLVKSLIKTELGIEEEFEIERAHRAGRHEKPRGNQPWGASSSQANRPPRPRNIVAKFTSWKAKEKVVKKAREVRPKSIRFLMISPKEFWINVVINMKSLKMQGKQGKLPTLWLEN